MKPVELVVGSIRDLDTDRQAAWLAFYRKDLECDALRLEVERLKATISRLRKKK